MRKRRVILILFGVLIAGAVLVFLTRNREPEYGGKKLSEWVETDFLMASADAKPQQREAIGHIGTNAVPYLVKWLGQDMWPLKRKFYSSRNPAIMPFRSIWSLFDKRDDRLQFGAFQALVDLGPKAEGAVPDLSRLASGTKECDSRALAIVVLGEIGKPGLPALVAALRNQQAQGGKWTADSATTARYLGINAWMDGDIARLAIPALLGMSKDPDLKISGAATDALYFIDSKPVGRPTP